MRARQPAQPRPGSAQGAPPTSTQGAPVPLRADGPRRARRTVVAAGELIARVVRAQPCVVACHAGADPARGALRRVAPAVTVTQEQEPA